MSRKIESSHGSSRSSAATPPPDHPAGHPAREVAWEIHPAPSRLLTTWHCAVHGLAVVSVAVCGLAWPVKLAAALALLAHALRRRPAPMPVRRDADGAWSLPSLGLERLMLRPGTAVGPFWACLTLGPGSGAGKAVTVLILADQLDRESWRRLQAVLRGGAPAGTVQARQG